MTPQEMREAAVELDKRVKRFTTLSQYENARNAALQAAVTLVGSEILERLDRIAHALEAPRDR